MVRGSEMTDRHCNPAVGYYCSDNRSAGDHGAEDHRLLEPLIAKHWNEKH